MSEETPYYGSREFVCEVCRRTFTPTEAEAHALATLERMFPALAPEKCSALCALCRDEVRGNTPR